MNAKTYTNEEKASALARCFWRFTGLLALHIGTFWIPFLKMIAGRNANEDLWTWIMLGGMAVNFFLSIVFIYKFARVLGIKYVWIFWILAANIPLVTSIPYLLLANKAHTELSRLGSRLAVQLSQAGAGVLAGLILIAGCYVFFSEIQGVRDHERLKKSGQPTTGTLQMVTRHFIDGIIPAGYSFDVQYGSRSKTFEVDSEQYHANTLPGNKFTHHDIALVYLPDHPEVVELASGPPSFLTGFGNAVFVISLGGSGLYAAVKKFPKNPRSKKASPVADPPAVNRVFTIDKRG